MSRLACWRFGGAGRWLQKREATTAARHQRSRDFGYAIGGGVARPRGVVSVEAPKPLSICYQEEEAEARRNKPAWHRPLPLWSLTISLTTGWLGARPLQRREQQQDRRDGARVERARRETRRPKRGEERPAVLRYWRLLVEKRVESGRGRVRLDWLLGQMVSSLLVVGGGYGRIRRGFWRMDAMDGVLRWCTLVVGLPRFRQLSSLSLLSAVASSYEEFQTAVMRRKHLAVSSTA